MPRHRPSTRARSKAVDTETTRDDDLEIEGRLRAYYEARHGPGRSADAIWRRVEPRLSEQESAEAVEFARSLSGLYTLDGHAEPAPANGVPRQGAPTIQ